MIYRSYFILRPSSKQNMIIVDVGEKTDGQLTFCFHSHPTLTLVKVMANNTDYTDLV